jgi:hypothetical protein
MEVHLILKFLFIFLVGAHTVVPPLVFGEEYSTPSSMVFTLFATFVFSRLVITGNKLVI